MDWVTRRDLGDPRLEGAHIKIVQEISCGDRTVAAR